MTSSNFETHRKAFDRNGFVMMRNVVDIEQLKKMKTELNGWIEESKNFTADYGTTADGRPRFDVESPSHSAQSPALRRISSPVEISQDFLYFARDNLALDLTSHIFSPNIKFVNSKINLKLPGSGTAVRYHQDFPFEPHSNDNLMTVLFFLDDVTLDNGPLEVVPGTHKGRIHSLWHDGVFTGAVNQEVEETAKAESIKCTGKAGDACLMHTRVLHGSAPNNTSASRSLFIVCYAAEDAIALDRNHIPSKYDGEIVRGVKTGRIRTSSFDMELPEYPDEASFFGQQEKN